MPPCNRRRRPDERQPDERPCRGACLLGARAPTQEASGPQPDRASYNTNSLGDTIGSITELVNSLEDSAAGGSHPALAKRPGRTGAGMLLDPVAEAKLRGIFSRCDTNGNGRLDKRVLIKICSTEGDIADFLHLPRGHMQEGLEDDDDAHEQAPWEEFCKFFLEQSSPHGGHGAASSSSMPLASQGEEDFGAEGADAPLKVRVRDTAGIERTVVFDGRPLSDQVRDLAEEFNLPEDQDFVLTEGVERPTICTRAQLLSMPPQVPLSLRSARDVARERLTDLRGALTSGRDKGGVASHLWGLLAVVHAEPGLAEAIVEEQGIHYVFLAALHNSGCTELAMACLCQLLRYEEGLNWLEAHAEEVSCDLFMRLFAVLFPCGDMEDRPLVAAIPGVPPRSSLCIALFLLHMFPERAALAAHSAAESEEAPFTYERMISGLDGDDYFHTVASISIISALGSATASREALRGQIDRALRDCADNAGALNHFHQGGRQEAPIEQLFSTSMGACAQVIISHQSERLAASSRKARMSDQVRVSDVFGGQPENAVERIKQLKGTINKLRMELRQRHATMCTMVPFMSVENSTTVEEALPAIIRSGWESIQWPRNYSLLHYAAECVDDPGVVELVGMLATDVDATDDSGMSARDHAVKKGRPAVVKVLERLSELQLASSTHDQAQVDGRKSMPIRRTTELQEKLSQLDDAPPELMADIETVLTSGWASVTWPSNFNALHRAAKCGHVDAMELLIYANADPTLKDDWDLTPLDYAVQYGHKEAQSILQHVMGSNSSARPSCVSEATPKAQSLPISKSPHTGEPADPASIPVSDSVFDETERSLSSAAGETEREADLRASLTKVVRFKRNKTMYASSFDLLKEHGRGSKPNELGLAQLRFELKRLKAENAKLQTERQRLTMGPGDAPTIGQTLGGPLDEANLQKYLAQLQAFGREAVNSKLMESALMGGLDLDDGAAMSAMNQLLLVQRLLLGRSNESAESASQNDDGQEEEVVQGGKSKGGKGKGKGKAGPPAPPGKGSGKGSPSSAKGKAKGKGSTEDSLEESQNQDKAAQTQSKPVITPQQPMKPLWWKMYVKGKQLQQGETIWDNVSDDLAVVPVDVLEGLFSKAAADPGAQLTRANSRKVTQTSIHSLKELRVVTDTQMIVGREAAVKKLPSAEDVACALEELNDEVLTLDRLQIVQDNACPTDAQLKLLTTLREENPSVPMALPEQYMWVVGQLPAYKQRIDCWMFVRVYAESHQLYSEALETLEPIIECFLESKALPSLLGFILAVGNYLNGGTNRGQADGFDLETLSKLEGVKDPNGKDLRHFIIDTFFNQLTDTAHLLVRDLSPCLANVARRIIKDSDGVETLSKGAILTLEDMDQAINALQSEVRAKDDMMQMVLQYIDDPADNFKLQMPAKFAQVRMLVDGLARTRDNLKEKYGKVLSWFKISAMKSSDLCLLWDNFLIPGNMIMNKPERIRKDVLKPRFCSNRPVTFDDIAVLWDIKAPASNALSSLPAPRTSSSRRRAKRGGQPLQSRNKTSERALVLQLQFAQRLMALQKMKTLGSDKTDEQEDSGKIDPEMAALKFARRLSARHQKQAADAQTAGGVLPKPPATTSRSQPARQNSGDRLAAAFPKAPN